MDKSPNYPTLKEWLNVMLSLRNLQQPDGRQLYQYRLTHSEFLHLENLLKITIAEWRFYYNFTQISQRPGFSALFVLYGSEWWRRRYDGSGFSWEPILDDLGVFNDEWNASQRSDCVKEGLRNWKLKALEGSGFRFLGAVAIQGGLPMKPLAQARGNIGHLLGRVLRMANNRIVAPDDIESWIETLQNYLPKSYRQPAIFRLLAQTAWTVLTLKQQAKLSSSENAVAKLDAAIPAWRDSFPLPVEDHQARSLIEQLVREAASIRIQKSAICLPVERFLEIKDEEWQISSSITLPETLEAGQLAKLFETEIDDLPRFGELAMLVGEKTRTVQIRKMAGSNVYRLENAAWGCSGETSLCEHLLRLTATDGRVWTAAAIKGQSLDDDLPWIYSAENSLYRFVRQGAGNSIENEVVVVVPPKWKISPQSNPKAEKIGVLSNPQNDIYRVTETVLFESEDGSICKIGVKHAEDFADTYEWHGRRWWLNFLNPSIAFRGKPKLYRVDEDGNKLTITGTVQCTALGTDNSNQWLGAVILKYLAGNELKHKTRMTLLPETAALSLKFGDAFSGTVIFNDWQVSNAIVVTPNVNFTRHIEGQSLILNLSVAPEHQAPAQVTVDLYWRHSATPVRLAVPFPAKGTRAFKSDGSEITNGSMLAFNELIGVRLSVLGGESGKRISLKMQTVDGKLSRRRILQTLPGAIGLEVRLTDFLTDIDHLLSLDDSPDARVKIALIIGNEESFTLDIARYATVIERGATEVLIKIETETAAINEITVLALKLQNPFEEPISLETNGILTDDKFGWMFAPEEKESGAWLIYPGADCQIAFRPTLWTVSGGCSVDSELARVVDLADQHERNKALNQLIIALADDYTHPGWEEICRLAELVGHLPLTTLDIWRRFSHSAEGMAALAFRYGQLPEGFVSRFAQELPFAWEVIPFAIWKKAIQKSYEYCCNIFGEEFGKMRFASHCETRINKLASRHGGLSFLIGLASTEFFPEKLREFNALKSLGDYSRQHLFYGENSHLMNLRRIHAEEEWIADKDNLLAERWLDNRINRYLHTENLGYQNAVINAPLLLAVEATVGKSSSWLKDPAKIHLLRSFRAFDPEWFDEAYNLTIVRCLADGLLDD